ncbi:MAG: TonB-dependent receptor [Acidobacteriota bacterium]
MSNFTKRFLAVAAVLLLAGTGAVFGQAQSGNLYGTVTDDTGDSLPGVTVTLTGGGAPQIQITNAEGQFRFLGLAPGSYGLTAELEGFSTVEYPTIAINVGRNTTIEVQLSPAVEETITVTAESPLLDERKVSAGSQVNSVELEKIPTSRDPWAILQTVPGVQTDRINVGGNESGQQSSYTGPGSSGDNAVWAVDGVVITDMTAVGSSPTYYDFDAFEEMNVATGGSDATLSTGGVTLNMVTKRGTNEWRGSGRYFYSDDSLQADLELDESELGQAGSWNGDSAQAAFSQGNRIVEIEDYGFEVGGPIVRDRLWFWANYGFQNPILLTISDVEDATELESYGGKLNAQITSNNSAIGFYMKGDKIKTGRNAGPTRPPATTWNQTGPTDIYKFEDTHIFNSSLFVTGMISHVGGGFQLTPQGGFPDGPGANLDSNFIWNNNFLHYETDRPQDQLKLDGSYFFNTGSISHELKFGAGYRTAEVTSLTAWPNQTLGLSFFGQGAIVRDGAYAATIDYTSLYVQDTLQVGNATINVGLRYDGQDGEMDAASVPGVPGFENANPDTGFRGLPTASFAGGDDMFEWTNITPRLGVTYALGEERKTLLRASYAQFADQLSHYSGVLQLWPIGIAYSYFTWADPNGDGIPTTDEFGDFTFDDGSDPLGASTPNQIDPDYEAGLTDEIILGIEHAILPELVVGFQATFRNLNNLAEAERLVIENGVTRQHVRSDYVQQDTLTGELPSGQSYSVPVYGLRDGVVSAQGTYLTNGDREQNYEGYAFTFNKRLSNRWMLRGNLTFSNWEWDIPSSEQEDPNQYLGNGNTDGADVLQGSGTGSGSKGGIYINSNYSWSLTGMYQVAPDRPWGFNVSASLNGREGYPVPYFRRTSLNGVPGNVNIQVADSDDNRNDDIFLVDLRLEKEFNINDFNFTLSIDGFNLTNEAYILQRQHRLGIGTSDHVQEIVSPRVYRFGVRFSFN